MAPQDRWMFPGRRASRSRRGNSTGCSMRRPGSRNPQAGDAAHIAAQLRHASARARHGHSPDPGLARTSQAGDDGALHARGDRHHRRGGEPDRQARRQGGQAGENQEASARRCRDSPPAVARSALEVADVFREHGAAWRRANAGHVSLGQLKVMSAIERCRTAALGGHVARCDDCAHTVVAFNSCRNRHCRRQPECRH